MVVIVEGVTEPELFMPALRRVLHEAGARVLPVTLAPTEDGSVVLDDTQAKNVSSALILSAAAEGGSPVAYEFAAKSMLLDDEAVVVIANSAALRMVSADTFSGKAVVLYIGPYDRNHFTQLSSAQVAIHPDGQFKTQSGTDGTYATQELTLRYGRLTRTARHRPAQPVQAQRAPEVTPPSNEKAVLHTTNAAPPPGKLIAGSSKECGVNNDLDSRLGHSEPS